MALLDFDRDILASLISCQAIHKYTSSKPREAENNPMRNKIRGRNMCV